MLQCLVFLLQHVIDPHPFNYIAIALSFVIFITLLHYPLNYCRLYTAYLHYIVMLPNPPSTRSKAPVTKLDARSDARNTAAPFSSSGVPKRFSGVCFRIDSTRSALKILRFCSAGKKPGIIAFTRMPCGANSRAKYCVTLLMPALDTEYVNTLDNGVVEDTDEILIMLPGRFCSIIFFAKI